MSLVTPPSLFLSISLSIHPSFYPSLSLSISPLPLQSKCNQNSVFLFLFHAFDFDHISGENVITTCNNQDTIDQSSEGMWNERKTWCQSLIDVDTTSEQNRWVNETSFIPSNQRETCDRHLIQIQLIDFEWMKKENRMSNLIWILMRYPLKQNSTCDLHWSLPPLPPKFNQFYISNMTGSMFRYLYKLYCILHCLSRSFRFERKRTRKRISKLGRIKMKCATEIWYLEFISNHYCDCINCEKNFMPLF